MESSASRRQCSPRKLSTDAVRLVAAAQPFVGESAAARTAQKAWEQTLDQGAVAAGSRACPRSRTRSSKFVAIQADVGKPIRDALAGDVLPLAEVWPVSTSPRASCGRDAARCGIAR